MTFGATLIVAMLGGSQASAWRPHFEIVQPDLFGAVGGQANAWADVDNDGDLDYFVAFRGRPNRFYRNDRGTFHEVAKRVGLDDDQETRAAAWGDFDADLYIGFADPRISELFRNDGGSAFTEVSRERGIDLNGHGVTSAWGDLDNDGLPDLYVANFIAGQPLDRDALFINGARFIEAIPDVILRHDATHGVQLVDFDRDGRLDLALTNNDPDGGGHPLFRNTATMRGRSMLVEVTDPTARRLRAGSEVRAYRAGTRELLTASLVDSGSGYCSQNDMPVHLGVNEGWQGRIDIEVTTLFGGMRRVSVVRNIDPDAYRGRSLRIITNN